MNLLKESFVALGHLFGLDIKTPEKDKKNGPEIGSPIRSIRDDGAVEFINASGGIFYQSYSNMVESLQTERELLMQFRRMSTCPEVNNAIQEIVNDAIVYPRSEKYPVKLDLELVDMTDKIKDKITDAFDYILSLLEFDKKAHTWFRTWYIDGRLPFYILPFNEDQDLEQIGKIKRGIKNLIYIDPIDIKKLRELNMVQSKEDPEVEVIDSIRELYLYFANDRMDKHFIGQEVVPVYYNGDTLTGIRLHPDSVVYATSGYHDDFGNVLSFLYNALKALNQLNSLEESMLIYRISRAPSRRVFYVDVGNLPTSKAEQYLTSLIARYKNRVSYDTDKGKISSETLQRAMVEDYWLPRREGSKGTEISTLQGSDTFNNVTDELDYFKQKLYTALGVPMSRMQGDTTFTFGKTGEITRSEVKFAKFITQLRRRFASELFNQLIKTECVMENILTEEEWKEVVEPNMVYVFDEDSYFAELKEIDVLATRISLLQTMDSYTDQYFSKEFVRRHVLFQTDEEIEELAKQREQDKKEEEEENGGEEGMVQSPAAIGASARGTMGASAGQRLGSVKPNQDGGGDSGASVQHTSKTTTVTVTDNG